MCVVGEAAEEDAAPGGPDRGQQRGLPVVGAPAAAGLPAAGRDLRTPRQAHAAHALPAARLLPGKRHAHSKLMQPLTLTITERSEDATPFDARVYMLGV